MSFPRYPEYKNSGVEWLGEVPAHWEVVPLRRIAQLQSGAGLQSECIQAGGEYPVFGGNGLRGFTDSFTHEGDFVLIGRQGALCGNVNIAHSKFWATEHALVVHPLRTFNVYWMGAVLDAATLSRLSMTAAQPGLAADVVGRVGIPLPPLPEQTAIAQFLDRETAELDALVADQERLIALLKEKRQAVISHAVTRGLNPDAPRKDSGVEWLGEVPAHWEVVPLMFITDSSRPIMYGIILPGPDVETGVAIVKGGDVTPSRLRLDTLKRTTFEIEATYARSRLRGGDLIYAIRGSIGAVELVPFEIEGANITQDVARIAPGTSIVNRWLLWTMRADGIFQQLASVATGATIKGINIFDLKRARIPLPPLPEQHAIVEYLDRETAKLDGLVAEAEHAIALLRERRSALISAAVTGQIDVRGRATEED